MLPDGKRGKTDLNVSTAAYGQAEVPRSRNPGKETGNEKADPERKMRQSTVQNRS
jgi:hypothetical protein